MKYQYVIFDLDNTLYPKKSGLLNQLDRQIDLYIGQKLSIAKTKITKLRYDYWKEYGTTLGGMIACHQINPEEYINYTYNVNVADYLEPDPSLAKVLSRLEVSKVVFSNSPLKYVEEVLEVLQIRSFFEKIYDIHFCNYIGKPNLSSYFKVLADLGVAGKECLLIDDTPVNVLAGEEAGITSILFGQARVNNIQWIISDLAELPIIIPKIQDQLTA